MSHKKNVRIKKKKTGQLTDTQKELEITSEGNLKKILITILNPFVLLIIDSASRVN